MIETATAPADRGARFAAIQEALAGHLRGADRMVSALHPAEIALLLESLPPRPRLLAWELIVPDAATVDKIAASLVEARFPVQTGTSAGVTESSSAIA